MRNIAPASTTSAGLVREFVQKAFTGLLPALLYFLPWCHPDILVAQSIESMPLSPTTSRLDDTHSMTHAGNVRPEIWSSSSIDLGIAPADLALEHMVLLLKRSPEQEAALETLLDAQQNRKSPQYHRWLTPSQYADQFGVSSETLARVAQWLQSNGMRVDSIAQSRMFIVFSGTNAQLQEAFHTQIHEYEVKGELHHANSSDPETPSAFAPVIAGITSLHDFHSRALHTEVSIAHADRSRKEWRLDSKSTPTFTTSVNGNTFYAVTPYDFAKIYNVAPLWSEGVNGSGQSIAIVSRSDISPADVDNFRASFGLPAKNLNIIYDGPNPGKTVDESEADLDVEWSGAIASNATIDLVVAGSTFTTDGSFLSAQYIVDNNVAPILSMSFGQCEAFLGASGNQSYAELWQQAAAQGISVFVASGDSASAACDQGLLEPAATWGLAVNGVASTPYDVAVGGTDFFANFANASTYWSSTNDANLSSALSYIPEVPWNNTCGSSDVLFAVQANGGTDATNEALCNDANYPQLLGTSGGGGGASNCISGVSQDLTNCGGGYPKPVWQSKVPGIPADQVRDLPDVSLFAGSGIWGSFYVFCGADASADGSCNYNNSNDVAFLAAGGTSFASPSFAGIMALVEQQIGGPQGNPNYTLYELAGQQYKTVGTACQSSTVAAGNACAFYDITDSSNEVACEAGTTDCNPTDPDDSFAVLPEWKATHGFDLASGLGSVNAYNIVHTWGNITSAELATQTTLTLSSATAPYGSALSGSVQVSASAGASGTPTGDIALEASNAPGNTLTSFGSYALSAGKASFSVNNLPAGAYPLIVRYGGDATFASSAAQSAVTITPGNTLTALSASRSSLSPGQGVVFNAIIQTTSLGNSPSGNITFTDSTTGATLGKVPVNATTSSGTGMSTATAQLTVASSQIGSGANSVIGAYSGDSNYSASTSAPVAVTLQSMFTVGVNPASVTLTGNGSGSAAITLTPNATFPLPITLSCGNLPQGMSCLFSPSVAPAGAGMTTSTVTIQYAGAPAQVRRKAAALTRPALPWKHAPGVVAFALLGLLMIPRRRRSQWLACMLLLATAVVGVSCGGSKNAGMPTLTVQPTATTLTSATSAAQLGAAVTFSVSVTSGGGTPTGVVILQNGSSVLGSQSLSNGSATFTVSNLPLGSNALVASYNGDSTHSGSSATLTETVELTSSINVIASDPAGDSASAPLSVTVQ
jgi:hypothetical protein